ncbi:MAG: P1 family peptidase [Anaerolineales bacterium]|jgi:L-aminopeptidase/D-esterase-like protein
MKLNNTITDIPGIEVGQAQDDEALTGCTVVLCRKGAVAGVDVRGGAPGTRETDLLDPVNLVEKVHAVVLAGGSAFGLDAASGVMRYLDEQGIGFDTGAGKVPIVPAAIIFDLNLGRGDVRPDAEMGYRAAASASVDAPAEGNVGAGTGASVGKIFGLKSAMKSGIGLASMQASGLIVGAMAAVNAFGDVIDPQNGQVIAGARSVNLGPLKLGEAGYFGDTLEIMKTFIGRTVLGFATRANTVIGVVATNAKLSKPEATKVAQMAQDGIARTIRPAHTMLDGDAIFALATGEKKADPSTVGAFAAEVIAQAILRAVQTASPAGGLPGLNHESNQG